MSTFSAFRSAAVEVLHLNTRLSLFRSSLCPAAIPGTYPSLRAPQRSFHASHSHRAWVKNSQTSKPKESAEARKAREAKLKEIGLRDNDIPYYKVQVSSPQGLGPLRTLRDVLAEVEQLDSQDKKDPQDKGRKRYHAQLIANDPIPIVKIIDFKEQFKKQKVAREKAKDSAAQKIRKEVQLTWSSSEADVETKLEKMKEELEKGYKVDLVIMPKKGVRTPGLDDMKTRAQEITTNFSEISKEWKETDFAKGNAIIYLQGIATPSTQTKEAKETGDVPKKVLLKQQRKQKEEERVRKKREQEEALGGIFPDFNVSL
ncbi:hypothetical protein P691DRAFT_812220 [Macrolepiota fuliginosa MF-IS2]|uniref:Translation initiation factor 3 N-terminal domain-containing protein n=1 Tax=Macrolepiota fuliginosa MF-IS2 TaxID=1400762 RepID=A0A9P6C304_9AGAR|nr:hypothetical protein P691DRAFT_812220 [Macrolepiota fuliginosa MF-IS2]